MSTVIEFDLWINVSPGLEQEFLSRFRIFSRFASISGGFDSSYFLKVPLWDIFFSHLRSITLLKGFSVGLETLGLLEVEGLVTVSLFSPPFVLFSNFSKEVVLLSGSFFSVLFLFHFCMISIRLMLCFISTA